VRRSIVRLSVVHVLAEHSPASTAGFAADRRVHPDPAGHAHADGSCVPDTTAARVGSNEGTRLSSHRAEERRGCLSRAVALALAVRQSRDQAAA